MRSRSRCIIIVFCAALASAGPANAAEGTASPGAGPAWVGYGGPNGSRVWADAAPPARFNDKTGKNVRWKIPLPNWGLGTPIVVGDKVFLTCEGGWPEDQDFPLLLCYDAATGKELWRRTLNHLSVTVSDETERAAIAKAWHETLARFRLAYGIFNEWQYGDKDAAKKKFADNGFKWKGWRGGGYGQLRSTRGKVDPERDKTARKAGLTLDSWQHGCGLGLACIGQTYPTPCSDGESVYVTTAFHAFFCFDLSGNLKWVRQDIGQMAGPFGNDYCKNARSPLIYKDMFISDIGCVVRAFDKTTGELRWKQKMLNKHTGIVSPVVIAVKGHDILLSGGPGNADLTAFLLPDGKRLPPIVLKPAIEDDIEDAPVEMKSFWHIQGGTMLVKYDEPDVVFFTGAGDHVGWGKDKWMKWSTPPPAAARFSFDGETLSAECLWAGIGGKPSPGNNSIGIVYHKGKVYHCSGRVLDALTGAAVAGAPGTASKNDVKNNMAVPPTTHFLLVAGEHVYGLTEYGGKGESKPAQQGRLSVHSLDGKKVAESMLHNAPVESEKKRQIVEQVGWNTWGFSYGCPFTVGDNRLYLRSNDYLWCIGEK